MTENEISYLIRRCIYEVYNTLGPGLLEKIYVAALCLELHTNGLKFRTEVPVIPYYKGIKLELGYRMDILVEELVLIEVKSIENLISMHHLIALNYVKIACLKLGILVNFNTDNIEKSIFRKVNNL